MSDRLFPPHLLHARWRTFETAGYTRPVTGIVYRGEPRPTCGMPLGGLDTGCIDVEPNGMFGYNTIFNHLAEPRALLNLPMLGLACRGEDGADGAWILISDTLGKRDTPQPSQSAVTFPPTDYAPLFDEIGLAGAAIADSDRLLGALSNCRHGVRLRGPGQGGCAGVVAVHSRRYGRLNGAGRSCLRSTCATRRALHRAGPWCFNFPGFGPQEEIQRRSLTGPLQGVLVESGRRGRCLGNGLCAGCRGRGRGGGKWRRAQCGQGGVEPDR